MPFDLKDTQQAILAAAVFLLVFALWLAALFALSLRRQARSRKIENRLGLGEPEAGRERTLLLWLDDRQEKTTVIEGRRKSAVERLDQLLNDAGWTLSSGELIAMLTGVCVLSLLLSFLFLKNLLPGAGVSGAVLTCFWFYMKHRIGRRTAAFERQFVDALDLAARSLRAGHPLVGAFQLIADEIAHPVGTLFLDICQQQSLGVSLEGALQNVASRSSNEDLKLFTTSVVIQLRSGGNLAEMMDRLAFVIRDRMRLNRRVRVLTAQTQLSKRVLLALPIFMFFLLNMVYPKYMVPLYTTYEGRIMLAIGTTGLLLGAWVMNRLSILRY